MNRPISRFLKHEVVILLLSSLACWGCQRSAGQQQSPTTPTAVNTSADLSSYAQMTDGSVVVDGHQFNWVISAWGSIPYQEWMYLEVNEQDAVGKQAGDNQVTVNLSEVVLSFSGLPSAVSQIVTGVKTVHDDKDQTYTECGRFAVVNGSVNIPLAYADLVAYFGKTHYSLWFQALGGSNGQGTACGQISLRGVTSGGQVVMFSKHICWGTNPVPTVTATSTATVRPYLDVVVSVTSENGTSDINEFDLQEPGGGAKMGVMYDDGTKLKYEDKTTGDADSVVVDTSWTSGADPFHMSVPAGTTLTGQYQAVVNNDWGVGSCPFTAPNPLPVTITVKTHTATQTFTCNVTCNSGKFATIGATFPAGTIQAISCP